MTSSQTLSVGYAAPSLELEGTTLVSDLEGETEIVEAIVAPLAVVLAVFATVGAWCLAVCWGDVDACHIHYNFPFDAEAEAHCG